jgi:hypothetical protein
MRLWNTLRTLYRGRPAGLRPAGNKGARRPACARARLEVEALDQRLLPSSVPNLAGVAIPPYTNTSTSLTIQSVQDQGGGKGTFVGVYKDTLDGVSTPVSGTIAFEGMANVFGGSAFHFGVAFSGSATHFQWNPRTGIWSESVDRASGSGDFYTTAVSGDASIYQHFYSTIAPGLWSYSGQESDSFTYSSPDGGYTLSESGAVWATNNIPR